MTRWKKCRICRKPRELVRVKSTSKLFEPLSRREIPRADVKRNPYWTEKESETQQGVFIDMCKECFSQVIPQEEQQPNFKVNGDILEQIVEDFDIKQTRQRPQFWSRSIG